MGGCDGIRGHTITPSLPSIVPASLFSFSRPRQRSRKDTEIGRLWWKAKWSWLLWIGIFRNESAGSTVSGPCSCGASPCTRRTALTPRRFDGEDAREQGMAGVARWAAEQFWEGYMNSLIFPSAIIFQSSLCSQQQAENFLYFQSFPGARNGHFCLQTTVYLQANSSAPKGHSNPLQTCSGTTQHPQEAPAHQVERFITQHATTSSSSGSSR